MLGVRTSAYGNAAEPVRSLNVQSPSSDEAEAFLHMFRSWHPRLGRRCQESMRRTSWRSSHSCVRPLWRCVWQESNTSCPFDKRQRMQYKVKKRMPDSRLHPNRQQLASVCQLHFRQHVPGSGGGPADECLPATSAHLLPCLHPSGRLGVGSWNLCRKSCRQALAAHGMALHYTTAQ